MPLDKIERMMLHKFEMLMRREEQRTRLPNVLVTRPTKNDNPEYRKN